MILLRLVDLLPDVLVYLLMETVNNNIIIIVILLRYHRSVNIQNIIVSQYIEGIMKIIFRKRELYRLAYELYTYIVLLLSSSSFV